MLTFFVISFLTNVIGPLSPEFIKDFKLSDLLAGLLPFAFFIAYGVMSIPSSMLVQKYNEKTIMVAAFVVGAVVQGAIVYVCWRFRESHKQNRIKEIEGV